MKNLFKKLQTVLCPFHEEKTPSCVIDLNKKTYHCMGCGKKGKLDDFTIAYMGGFDGQA